MDDVDNKASRDHEVDHAKKVLIYSQGLTSI